MVSEERACEEEMRGGRGEEVSAPSFYPAPQPAELHNTDDVDNNFN